MTHEGGATDASGASVRIKAHAKINLFLAVGARRADGYHDVTTVLQALELCDIVSVEPCAHGVTIDVSRDLGVAPEQNLAVRAARALLAARGEDGGARIRLEKRIPAGAGLGGGSADAAAVLAALAGWRRGEAADPDLMSVAASLGADVPFFLGPGTALMVGRGDEVAEVLPTPRLHVVLVNPGAPVPTGAAYAHFDRMLAGAPRSVDAMLRAVRSGDAGAIAAELYDNMTEASACLVPEIGHALRSLADLPGVLGCAMAGSGSTVFGVCEDERSAADAASAAAERGWWACATRTTASGLTFA